MLSQGSHYPGGHVMSRINNNNNNNDNNNNNNNNNNDNKIPLVSKYPGWRSVGNI